MVEHGDLARAEETLGDDDAPKRVFAGVTNGELVNTDKGYLGETDVRRTTCISDDMCITLIDTKLCVYAG